MICNICNKFADNICWQVFWESGNKIADMFVLNVLKHITIASIKDMYAYIHQSRKQTQEMEIALIFSSQTSHQHGPQWPKGGCDLG